MDLYLNYSLRKSRFPLSLTDIHTDRQTYILTDISVYRVASLLKSKGITAFLSLKNFGSGSVNGNMLLVRIIENNKIDAYFRSD